MGEHGANSEGSSALAHAVRGRNLAAARKLLVNEPNVNTVDATGMTPLLLAARSGMYMFVTLLLSWGANLEDKCPTGTDCVGDTPLWLSLKLGFYENFVQLLTAGANIEVTDAQPITMCYYAAEFGLLPYLTLLLLPPHSCNVEFVDVPGVRGVPGVTVLFHAVRNGQPAVVQALLDVNANTETSDTTTFPAPCDPCVVNLTPLWYAALAGHTVIVEKLVAAGANKEVTDVHGWTPLAMASTYDRRAMVSTLITAGANKAGLLAAEVKNYQGKLPFWEWDEIAPGFMGTVDQPTNCPPRQDGGCPWRDNDAMTRPWFKFPYFNDKSYGVEQGEHYTQVFTLEKLLRWRGFPNMVVCGNTKGLCEAGCTADGTDPCDY